MVVAVMVVTVDEDERRSLTPCEAVSRAVQPLCPGTHPPGPRKGGVHPRVHPSPASLWMKRCLLTREGRAIAGARVFGGGGG